jgi:pSer/pThr/pTyr-binding forkhead associated (FHA) protein
MPRVTITVPDRTPQPYRFQLDRRVVSLGRGSDNDIAIDCGSVSVRHAEMVRTDGGYEIHDLGSTNGTKKHGERQMTIPLSTADTVYLGDVSFDFQLSEEEISALALETNSLAAPLNEMPDKRIFPQPIPRAASMTSASATAGGGGAFMFLVFLVLGSCAFFIGMSMRYQKDTHGKSLFKELTKPHPEVKPASALDGVSMDLKAPAAK